MLAIESTYDWYVVRMPIPISVELVDLYHKLLTREGYKKKQFLPRAYHEPFMVIRFEKGEWGEDPDDKFMNGLAVVTRVFRYGVRQRQILQRFALKVNARLVHEEKVRRLGLLYPDNSVKSLFMALDLDDKEIVHRADVMRLVRQIKKKRKAGKDGLKTASSRQQAILDATMINLDSPSVVEMVTKRKEIQLSLNQAYNV